MISFAVMLVVSLLLDGAVRPCRVSVRRWQGMALHVLVMSGLFGFGLAASGNPVVAAVLAGAMMALFTLASNAKYAMLGEPLVFSDLALLGALVRHPRFYFTAISVWQRWAAAAAAALTVVVLGLLFSPQLSAHLVGGGLLLGAGCALPLALRAFDGVAAAPDLEGDLARYGLIASLLLYWRRWQRTTDPAPPTVFVASAVAPEIVVIVQCESFADPVALTGDPRHALPGLAYAREVAWQSGDLEVSGFGAYTMRTEFGVLFGRDEAALGFRRYDPFLTAHGETSHALPARLRMAGYRAAFVHPHDLRFYGRDRLMPAIGFDRVIGEEGFAALPPGGARYVDDRTLGRAIGDIVAAAAEPSLVYAVTMENHGPWDSDRADGPAGKLDAYLRHLRSSDAMLSDLIARLAGAGKPALLAFFGDHRPSILGVSMPGGARHTPYVMVRFREDGVAVRGDGRPVALTPDALHHAILDCIGRS